MTVLNCKTRNALLTEYIIKYFNWNSSAEIFNSCYGPITQNIQYFFNTFCFGFGGREVFINS